MRTISSGADVSRCLPYMKRKCKHTGKVSLFCRKFDKNGCLRMMTYFQWTSRSLIQGKKYFTQKISVFILQEFKMFAFAVRLRRKKDSLPRRVKPEDSGGQGAKYFFLGVILMIFGGIFLIFESVGRCNCKMDFIGYVMLGTGFAISAVSCLRDCPIHEDDDQIEDDEREEQISPLSPDDLLRRASSQGTHLLKPTLLSREVSLANQHIRAKKNTVVMIPCQTKINSKSSYNLPSVSVDV